MKRLFWFASGVTFVGCAMSGALGGCGSSGDDSSGIANNDAAANGDSTTGDDGGGGTDGSTPGDSGGTNPDGSATGPVSNPGVVNCGASLSCDLDGGASPGRPFCCEEDDGGDHCATNVAGCGGNAVSVTCDEPADCPTNRKCCLQINIVGGVGPAHDGGVSDGLSTCNPNCAPNDLELCKTAAQCGDGGACALRTCRGGGTFYACNTNDDCK